MILAVQVSLFLDEEFYCLKDVIVEEDIDVFAKEKCYKISV